MATISEILARKWPGQEWSLAGDDYATLVWGGPAPKPTEAEIRAFSAEVDALIAAEAKAERKLNAIVTSDSLLQALEILADAVADLQAKARVTSALAASSVNKITSLAAKLAQIRAG